jgi:hypothetical protein
VWCVQLLLNFLIFFLGLLVVFFTRPFVTASGGRGKPSADCDPAGIPPTQESFHDQIEERFGIVAFVGSVLVEDVEVGEQVEQLGVWPKDVKGKLDDLRAWRAVLLAEVFDLLDDHFFSVMVSFRLWATLYSLMRLLNLSSACCSKQDVSSSPVGDWMHSDTLLKYRQCRYMSKVTGSYQGNGNVTGVDLFSAER